MPFSFKIRCLIFLIASLYPIKVTGRASKNLLWDNPSTVDETTHRRQIMNRQLIYKTIHRPRQLIDRTTHQRPMICLGRRIVSLMSCLIDQLYDDKLSQSPFRCFGLANGLVIHKIVKRVTNWEWLGFFFHFRPFWTLFCLALLGFLRTNHQMLLLSLSPINSWNCYGKI